MRVGRMRIPLGVIAIIYESRPNVTVDAAALCVKAGNAVVLRGGSEAIHSNRALGDALRARGRRHRTCPSDAVSRGAGDGPCRRSTCCSKFDRYIDLADSRAAATPLIRKVMRRERPSR